MEQQLTARCEARYCTIDGESEIELWRAYDDSGVRIRVWKLRDGIMRLQKTIKYPFGRWDEKEVTAIAIKRFNEERLNLLK